MALHDSPNPPPVRSVSQWAGVQKLYASIAAYGVTPAAGATSDITRDLISSI
jgi:hypothetical protein